MKTRLYKLFLSLSLAVTLGVTLGVTGVQAQATNGAQAGLDSVAGTSGLPDQQDPTIIVAKIIRGFLGVLGIIAVVIIMYAGFLWMTAGGNEERVSRAKRMLINASVGLFIIFTSMAITQFVLQALVNATGGNGGGGVVDDGGAGGGLGGGSSNVFAVTSQRPTGQVSIRNIVPQITFSKNVDQTTVTSENIVYSYTLGNSDPLDDIVIPGTLTLSGNRVSFVPATPCPAPNDSRFCFDENAEVKVTVSSAIKSTTGTVLSCTNNLCSATFTSGAVVDTENPVADLTLPDDSHGVPSGSIVLTQVHATDDAEVAIADFAASDVVFDSVPASGADLTDVLIDSDWDTTGLLNGSSYRLTVTVVDIAGNTDADTVTVRVRPNTCFDTSINGIETGLNCGGDSTSTEYCGACDGSSCTSGNECSSGLCLNGICSAVPEITAITPPGGAPGSWVTITGKNFGNLAGSVTFTGATGQVQAKLAACNDVWSGTQVIVEIPVGAEDGPITLKTSTGLIDTTFDDNGVLIADFDVNSISHPGLCSLSPRSGAATDAVTLEGAGLGASQMASSVNFGSTPAGSYTGWADGSASVTVPGLINGEYAVTATVNGSVSNALAFAVTSGTSLAPVITDMSPTTGGVGQYVTISGTNFGGSTGTVWFESKISGDRTLANNTFPAACVGGQWSDQEVIVKVPDGLSGALGDYNVYLEANTGADKESNKVDFNVSAASPTPGLCKIDPEQGLAGESVSLLGENFGSSNGVVTFFSGKTAIINSWASGTVSVKVPDGAVTGQVTLANSSGAASNPVNFEVSAGEAVGPAVQNASYAWSFSSGEIPAAPRALFECSAEAVTGVPNDQFDNGPGVCVNASIYLEFSLPMNQATLVNGSVEECVAGGNNPCAQTVQVTGTRRTTSQSVTFEPTTNLKTSTTYRVTITDRMLAEDGTPLENPGSWTFVTRPDATLCRIEDVRVSPGRATITVLNGTRDFSALPVNGCTVLQNVGFSWGWSISPSVARFDTTSDPTCAAGNSTCALAQALAEGVTPVTAIEVASGVSGHGDLTVDFSDPYITNSWPNCNEACVNAEVGASFNTAMDEASIVGNGQVSLYKCTNEVCTSSQLVSGTSVYCVFDANNDCTGFAFSDLALTPSAFYRVVVAGDVMSTSGVALTRANYGGDYSWMFRVRQDASVCAVDRISLSPNDVLVDQVGAQRTFTSEAFGEADSCSVSGQRLSGFSYNWNWTNPIADNDLDNNGATRVAAWNNGVLADVSLEAVPNGCTASCTAAGSRPQTAICGDGIVDPKFEECEDGNVASDDGCSASCLNEGNSTATCGNGVVNPGEHEDCDDGNKKDHDGCSSICLAEGSDDFGATCGNDDLAFDARTLAGEECDDGNAARGDGCSNECLLEGSVTLDQVGGALCGDGQIDRPTEECDSQAGCSTRCLWVGSASTCGTGGIQPGEACDDGNSQSGDGCSKECLLEGASTEYSVPSFCGDGLVGTGELAMCEASVAGDGRVDPIQVAAITTDAVKEVDDVSHQAVATLEVTETSSNLTTTSTFALSCAAENDTQCLEPQTFGAGENGCCMERPTVTLFPAGQNVCRNAALYGIFTQEMNTDDLSYEVTENGATVTKYRMYAKLDTNSTGGVCPSDHTTLAVEPRNLVLRLWNTIVRFVTGRSAQAAAGDCVAPIESFEQQPFANADGSQAYRVTMHTRALLAAKGVYTLVVEGDDDVTDAVTTGATTKYGVGLNSGAAQSFTVGNTTCALDEVRVLDTDAESPYVFSVGEEQHTFTASAFSHATGIPQEIAPIDGVYAWNWGSWQAEKGNELVTVDGNEATAEVKAIGKNGDDTIFATATIKDNVGNLPGLPSVTGGAPILIFVCENPWPSPFGVLPWSDSADGDVGAEEGPLGWMYYSTMYCRDAGSEGFDDDLPNVTVVRPPTSASAGVIKEYLYEIDGSSDAVGVRIVSNPSFLSPAAWYSRQGFRGDLNEVEVDGYQAVKDGRTTYVVAPNQSDAGDIFPNVYVISYNEGANDKTIDIYNQMVDNLKFAINVDDAVVCAEGETTCSSSRDRLRRDTRRLTDMTDIKASVLDYYKVNGVVPTLPAGSFVRALSSSVWGSWSSLLGGALGMDGIPADPLNVYALCGQAGSGYEAYDAETCVDQTVGSYVCPLGSHAYHYKAVGENQAYLYADLEYSLESWTQPIDDGADPVHIQIGNSATGGGFVRPLFCDGTSVFGASTACGDGVVGGGEVCELGQLGGSSVACTTTGGLFGSRSQACNSTCSGFADNPAAVCVVASCGNGVTEPANGETCDDGSKNGAYGFCGNDCTRDTAFFCGDGKLAGGEACDCGSDPAMSYADARAYAAAPGSCADVNGVYAGSPNSTCAWNCAGPASYCGDGTVDAGEVCDGEDETWAGALCGAGSTGGMLNKPCTSNAECGGTGVCGGNGTGNRAACPVGFTRVKACNDDPGSSCTYASNNWLNIACTEIGTCGDTQQDPGEACDDGNTDGTDSCTDVCLENVCGDGRVYVGVEQCDEGLNNGKGCDSAYGSSCTACSLSCRYEVASGSFCGDGEKNGDEFCDANDIPYTWYYAAATNVDNKTFGTCAQLGNTMQHNGHQYVCSDLGVCNGGPNNGNYCTDRQADCGGSQCVRPTCAESCTSSCPFVYSSVPLQLKTNQPGSATADSAEFNSYRSGSTAVLPNAATLTVPACNVATELRADVSLDGVTLPTTYILFITDLSYSMKNEVADNSLPEAGESSRLDIAKEAIPGAIEELFDKLGSDAQIGLIGYRGLVAGECFDDARESCSVIDPCSGGGVCNEHSSDMDSNGNIIYPYGSVMDFVGPSGEADLADAVSEYTYDYKATGADGHGTFTYEALAQAKEMFDEIKNSNAGRNARYVAILLSDGEVTDDTNSMDGFISPNPILIAQDFDHYIPETAGYELYTATIGDIGSQITNMKNWSSNSFDDRTGSYATSAGPGQTLAVHTGSARNTSTFNGLDYAYDGDSDQAMRDMYDEIVNSIVTITATIVADDGENVVSTTGPIEEGDNVILPWPTNFVCDDLHSQQVPIQITFPGLGMVEVSDVRLNYCAP